MKASEKKKGESQCLTVVSSAYCVKTHQMKRQQANRSSQREKMTKELGTIKVPVGRTSL